MLPILLIFARFFLTSIYAFTVTNQAGDHIGLSSFEGRKILMVNTPENGLTPQQLEQLVTLQSQAGDSLVVLLFPSATFSAQVDSATLGDRVLPGALPNLVIAQAASVDGDGAQPIFKWLADPTENGRTSVIATSNFTKILLDESGMVVGVFSDDVDFDNASLLQAVNTTY